MSPFSSNPWIAEGALDPLMRWPNSTQTLLLQAALLPREQARCAWQKWLKRVDLLQLDPDSNGFIALLDANLRRAQVTSEWSDLLKGNYRHLWTRNQIAWRETAVLVEQLTRAGVDFILLGPQAALLSHYRDAGVRPIGIPWVLVRATAVASAGAILNGQARWASHLYPEFVGANDDDPAWKSSVLAEFSGVRAPCLAPAEQFLWTCITGFRDQENLPLWSLADAVTILQSSPNFDWNHLFHEAARRQFLLPVHRTLDFIQHRLESILPEGAAQRPRIGSFEYLEYRLRHRRIWRCLQPWLGYARTGGTISYAENSGLRRTLYFAINRGWHHVRRRGPGWLRQSVKKITAATHFQAPWLIPTKK